MATVALNRQLGHAFAELAEKQAETEVAETKSPRERYSKSQLRYVSCICGRHTGDYDANRIG
jgi:hypothetical protein